VLIIRRSILYYTASGIITPVGGRPVHRLREDSLTDMHGQQNKKKNLTSMQHVRVPTFEKETE